MGLITQSNCTSLNKMKNVQFCCFAPYLTYLTNQMAVAKIIKRCLHMSTVISLSLLMCYSVAECTQNIVNKIQKDACALHTVWQ